MVYCQAEYLKLDRYFECVGQCSDCKYGRVYARYPVPAIYSGPSNPAYWVIGWLSWHQAKEYVALRQAFLDEASALLKDMST